MPIISIFYGLIIRLFFADNEQHNYPHIHVEYQNFKATIRIPDGKVLSGKLPPKKLRMVRTWIDIHEEELMVNWSLATKNESVFRIEPLR